MDRNGRLLGIILAILIFANVSDASFFAKLRQLAVHNSGDVSVPPSPSPDPSKIHSNKTSNERSSKNPKVPDPETKTRNDTGKPGPSPLTRTDKGKSGEADNNNKKKKNNKKDQDLQPVVSENCTGVDRRCRDQKSLTACILNLDTGSKELVILVQNEGEDPLKLSLSAPNPSDNVKFEIPEHKSKKMNLKVGNSSEIILKAGNGECVLRLQPPVSRGNFYVQLHSFEKLITPINGAYFLIFSVIVFGGTWTCCLFRKRRRQDGIPYQELEMGVPESAVVNDVESAEGWDQGWDDDWEEGSAVKSPAAHNVGNISANGLTSRSPNRDGWENDWDD